MTESTGGGTGVAAQGASAAEAQRLQARSTTHLVYSTAYVEIERRTEAMQRMRNAPEARRDDEPNGARWAREDLVALPHVRKDERSIALDAMGRSIEANRGYASLMAKEAPELVHAVEQNKADRAAAMAEVAQQNTMIALQRLQDGLAEAGKGALAGFRSERDSSELPRVQVGNDPSSWNNANAQTQRDLADRLGLTRDIESLFAKGMTAGQVTKALNDDGRLTGVPREEQSSLVIGTRATLGIPSRIGQEGQQEFDAWKQQRNERIAAASDRDEPGRAAGDPKREALTIDPASQEAVAMKRAVETAAVMRELGMNMVEPEPKRERGMDEPEVAKLRDQVKGGVGEQDPERDAKREAIDRASDAELGKIAAAGKDPSKLSLAFDTLVQRLQGDFADPNGRKPNPPLEERFNVVPRFMGRDYEFRDQPGKVAFEDRLLSLRTGHNSPSAAIAMMDRAAERGWSKVRVNGTEEFKRQAWIAAEARGIKAVGYEPTKGDRDAASSERMRLDNEQRSRATPAAQRDAEAKRTDAECPAPSQSQGLATPAVLRAFDMAMERQGIAPPQQDALRKELGRQLEAMQAVGRTPLVKVYDKDAPRVQAPAAPKVEHRRASSERVR